VIFSVPTPTFEPADRAVPIGDRREASGSNVSRSNRWDQGRPKIHVRGRTITGMTNNNGKTTERRAVAGSAEQIALLFSGEAVQLEIPPFCSSFFLSFSPPFVFFLGF